MNSRLQSVAMYASVPVAFALFAGGGLAGLRVSRSPMYQRHMLLVAACVGVLSLGLYVWLVWLRRAASVSQPSAHASRCPPVAILCLMCLVVTTLNAPLSGLWESVSAWPVELPKALVLEAFLLGVLWARWSEYAAQRSREEGRRPDGEGSKSVDG